MKFEKCKRSLNRWKVYEKMKSDLEVQSKN